MPIQRAITRHWSLLNPYPVIPSIPSTQALASCLSTRVRYAFTVRTLNQNLNTRANTELQCVQLITRYIRLVMTLMLGKLPHHTVYCHAVCCILRIVELCSDVFDYGIRMLSIMVVLGSHEFGLPIWLWALGGSQISTGREDFADDSAVLPMLSDGLQIELSDLTQIMRRLKVITCGR